MENNFNGTVTSLFQGMESFITTKTVVGEAINVNGTIILPLVDVSFGVSAGSVSDAKATDTKERNQKEKSGGAMGAKMSPSAVLVIHDGVTKLVNVKNQDAVTKILDMVPDLVNKFFPKKGDNLDVNAPDIKAATDEAINNYEK